jgi:hypothetical protein
MGEFPNIAESCWCGEYTLKINTINETSKYPKPPGVYINQMPLKVGEYVIR